MQTSPTLGFIGLGVMGGPMCLNVVAKHSAPVVAFDLNEAALNEVVEAGAKRASSIADVAANADVIFLSLPGGKQVEAVCFGERQAGEWVTNLSSPAAQARRAKVRSIGYGVRSDFKLNFGRYLPSFGRADHRHVSE